MSSLHVNDELLQQAIAIASAQGKTVEEFADEALRQALGREALHRAMRNGLPTMVVNGSTPVIDPCKVRRLVEEEGF
jgi:hypothetical protein